MIHDGTIAQDGAQVCFCCCAVVAWYVCVHACVCGDPSALCVVHTISCDCVCFMPPLLGEELVGCA